MSCFYLSNNLKSRWFNLLLYPDNPKHLFLIGLLQTNQYKACGCLHNNDVYEDGEHKGELKKSHFHFIVKFDNPRYVSGVAKEFEIEERFIQVTKSIKGSAQYLLHYGLDDKFQYNVDDLVGTLKGDVVKLINSDEKITETEAYYMLTAFIDSSRRILTVRAVGDFLADNGLYSFFRRNFSIIRCLIDDNNEKIYKNQFRKG